MNRRNQILAGLAVVQLLLVVLVFARSGPKPMEAGALYPDLREGSLASITIEDGDGNRLALAKKDGKWVLPDAGDYPVDESKVEELEAKLRAIQTNRLVARTDAAHRQLKVHEKQFERRVTFKVRGGEERTIYIGKTLSARASHVRDASDDAVYLASDLSAWQVGTSPSSWIDTVYLKVDKEKAVVVQLENGQGTFTFQKDENGSWKMDGLRSGETFDESKLTSLLNRLTSLRMTKPLGKEEKPEYGLGSPSATVTVTLREESPTEGDASEDTKEEAPKETKITLRIGKLDEEESAYPVRSSESEFVVLVSKWNVEDFVERTRDDFLKKASE